MGSLRERPGGLEEQEQEHEWSFVLVEMFMVTLDFHFLYFPSSQFSQIMSKMIPLLNKETKLITKTINSIKMREYY